MAGGWLKMRTSLRRNAKVIAMARFLAKQPEFVAWLHDLNGDARNENVTKRNENVTGPVVTRVTFSALTRVTVATLLEVWGCVRDVIDTEHHVPLMGLADINEVAAVPMFAEAMVEVGWVREHPDDGGLIFPNFGEYNSLEHDRKPKTGAERARDFRARKKEREAAEAAELGESAGDGDAETSVTERNENVTESNDIRGEERRGEEKEKKGAAGAARAPTQLGELVDWCQWWNELHSDGLVGNTVKTKRIAKGIQDSWRRVLRSPELCDLLSDRDKLRGAIQESYCGHEGWFRLAKLFGASNKAGEYIVQVLLDGGYREDVPAKTPTIDISKMEL